MSGSHCLSLQVILLLYIWTKPHPEQVNTLNRLSKIFSPKNAFIFVPRFNVFTMKFPPWHFVHDRVCPADVPFSYFMFGLEMTRRPPFICCWLRCCCCCRLVWLRRCLCVRDLYFDWFFILYIMLNILFIYIAISIRHIS